MMNSDGLLDPRKRVTRGQRQQIEVVVDQDDEENKSL